MNKSILDLKETIKDIFNKEVAEVVKHKHEIDKRIKTFENEKELKPFENEKELKEYENLLNKKEQENVKFDLILKLGNEIEPLFNEKEKS